MPSAAPISQQTLPTILPRTPPRSRQTYSITAIRGGLQATDEGGVKYVLQDWQGSTRAVVGNSGSVRSRIDYTAYGESVGTGTGTRTAQQGFGGNEPIRQRYGLTERDDATGLDHTWFRKHENQAGRWTSPDPYNGSMTIGDPQSFNRYSYVDSQPTDYVDPSGLNGQPTTVFEWCEADRYDEETGTLYVGRCYRYVMGSGSGGTIGTTITGPEPMGFPGGDTQTGAASQSCKSIKSYLSQPQFKAMFDNAWTMSNPDTPNAREMGGVVRVNDDTRLFEVGYVEGESSSVPVAIAAQAWIMETSPNLGRTHNIAFEFYFHTHPHKEGTKAPNGRTWIAERASPADRTSFRRFNLNNNNPGRGFAVIVTHDNIVVYDSSDSSLCSFAR